MSTSNNPLAEDLDHVVKYTLPLWEDLRGSRIFITGGTGFFGCWLLETFLWAQDKLSLGASAWVLTRSREAFLAKAPNLARHPAVHLVGGDVSTFEYPAVEFPFVIHAASQGVNGGPAREGYDADVQGTRHVLELARARGTRRLLFTSSGAVYGKQPSNLPEIPEDYPGAPALSDVRSFYGQAKRASEFLCALYAEAGSLVPTIARCFAFLGPYLPLDAHYAASSFLRDALDGGPIRVAGDGTTFRSYLYAADLAIWLWTILLRGASCRPYNVGSMAAVSIADLAMHVRARVAPNTAITIAQKPTGTPPQRYVPCTIRAQTELGLRQIVDLDDAVRRAACWHDHRRKLAGSGGL